MRRILYVDDDAVACRIMREVLASQDLDVVGSDDDARALARKNAYDLYVVAGGTASRPGLELCAWLQRIDGRTPIVFCSANGTAKFQQAAIAAGAVRYLVKPLDPALLRSTLGLLLKLADIESQRAMAMEQAAIQDDLLARARLARTASVEAREQANLARQRMLRVKAYRAFRDAGGNRANFERLWQTLLEETQASER